MSQQDSLGLSLAGLRAYRWQMPSAEPAPVARWRTPDRGSARSRFEDLPTGSVTSRLTKIMQDEGA